MKYFSHDTNASGDELVMQLRMEHGGAAVDAYWAILEYIYAEEQPLPFGENRRETKSVCHRLCLGFDEFENYVKTMVEIGLLLSRKYRDANHDLISSPRAAKAIEAYKAKAETARHNGKKGGRPRKPSGNPRETESVSASVSEKNQTEKLLRIKTKRVGLDKLNQTLPAGAGAALEGAAPPSGHDPSGIPSQGQIERQRAEAERMEADAIPCPEEVMAQVMAATGGAR